MDNCNDRVWVENPASCKDSKGNSCENVQKYKTVNEPYEKCDEIPYVDENDCQDVAIRKCETVTQNNCIKVPYDDCREIPYEDCKNVYKSVPEQVARKRPFGVCGYDDETPYEFTDKEIEEYDFDYDFDVQTKSVEQIPDCDETGNQNQNSSGGVSFACGSSNSQDPNESTEKENDDFVSRLKKIVRKPDCDDSADKNSSGGISFGC